MNTTAHDPPRRAAPLPPDERRRAILQAVAPVILERGISATTRELAEAAGVAEGTLFRVFDDKATLMRAAVHAALDPAAAVPAIDAIDRSLPLRDRLLRLATIGFSRVDEMMRWMGLLHEVSRAVPDRAEEEAERGRREWTQHQEAGTAALKVAVVDLLMPDAASFRLPVGRVADLFDVVLIGTAMQAGDLTRRGRNGPTTHDPEELVELLLHGVLRGTPIETDAPAPVPALERTL
ncbi:TetR/AcrR family transcriptional regulator [Cellulomonas sp. URHB0016]